MKTIWIVLIIIIVIGIGLLIWGCETSPTIDDEDMINDNNEFTNKS